MEKDAPILVTGAEGFIGKNLTATLKTRGYTDVLAFDVDTPKERLGEYAARSRFVLHLAGINRPQDPKEFYEGNRGFTEQLLYLLKAADNRCPVLVTSSSRRSWTTIMEDRNGGGGAGIRSRAGHRRAGLGVPPARRVWEMVPSVVQQRGGDVLPPYCPGSAHRGARPGPPAAACIYRRRSGLLCGGDGGPSGEGSNAARLLPLDGRRYMK